MCGAYVFAHTVNAGREGPVRRPYVLGPGAPIHDPKAITMSRRTLNLRSPSRSATHLRLADSTNSAATVDGTGAPDTDEWADGPHEQGSIILSW
jgi:hypothetical protein